MANLQRCQIQRSNTPITAEIMQTYDLLKFASTRSYGSSFLLITQYEMPFINKSEETKRPKDRKTNGKCTNSTNHRSRVWPVFLFTTAREFDLITLRNFAPRFFLSSFRQQQQKERRFTVPDHFRFLCFGPRPFSAWVTRCL